MLKNKVKILSLFSIPLLTLLVSTSISSRYASYNHLNVKNNEMIVIFNDGYDVNDFKEEVGNSLDKHITIKETYSGLVNGVLVDTTSTFKEVLPSLSSVSSVSNNNSYKFSTPNTLKEYKDEVVYEMENNSKERMNVPTSSEGGEGTLVAVLDSSFDLTHNAYKALPSGTDVKLTESDVRGLTKDLEATNQIDFYFNNKIPFYHDYGGTVDLESGKVTEDDNILCEKETHGMHVASIATANGEFEGIAPNSQLAFMKVGSEDKAGNQYFMDSSMLKAVNDCYTLGVDVVNISIGGDLNEFELGTPFYEALDKLEESGVTVSVSGGNAGKGNWQNSGVYMYDTTATIEEGTMGSFSNSEAVTSVASINFPDDESDLAQLSVNGVTISGRDQVAKRGDSDRDGVSDDPPAILPFQDLIPEGQDTIDIPYVIVPGLGSINNKDDSGKDLGNDYEGIDVKGKVAVVKRGSLSFSDKIANAKSQGAVACIIANDEGLGSVGYFDLTTTTAGRLIPTYSITAEDYQEFVNAESKILTIGRNEVTDFSTNGVTADLRMKVEISAPGRNVAGAVHTKYTSTGEFDSYVKNGYNHMSGTSMASPNYAGAVSLILGEQEFKDETEELAYKDTIKARTMSTTNILYQANGAAYSPRRQGAGLVDVERAINSGLYLTGNGSGAKVELKNNQDIMNGHLNFDVTIHNEEGKTGKYNGKLLVQVPETKYYDGESSPEFKGVKFQTINDVLVAEVPFSVDLTGDTEQTFKIDYKLSDSVKNELNSTFENGTYIEGYVVLEGNDLPTLSIPYLGFFGDYSKGDAVEDFDFERETGKVYQSDLLNNLSEVTGINKPNANFSSLIGVTAGGLNAVSMDDIITNDVDPYSMFQPIIYQNIDGKYHLYAGAEGNGDTLYIQQFVNRSVVDNTITMKDSSGKTVLTDHMFSVLTSDGDDYTLFKTITTPSLFGEGYIANRAYTIIPLKDKTNNAYYEDGEYTLTFEYELLSGYTQTKEYVLHISSQNEFLELSDAKMDKEKITLYFEKEVFKVSSIDSVATMKEENGLFAYTINIPDPSKYQVGAPYLTIQTMNYSKIYGIFNEEMTAMLYGEELKQGTILGLKEQITPTEENPNLYNVMVSTYSSSGAVISYRGGASLVFNLGKEYTNSSSKVSNLDGSELSFTKNGQSIFIKDAPKNFNLDKGVPSEEVDNPNSNTPSNMLIIILSIVGGVLLIGLTCGLIIFFMNKKKKNK